MPDVLTDLMQVYSRRGLSDWTNDADYGQRSAAGDCLPNAIVENEWEVGQVIAGHQCKFIPMPRHGYKKLEWCFFWPKRVQRRLRSLTLFVLVNRANRHCIAFRFESSTRGAHGYTHVQLTSKWSRPGVGLPAVPQWLPTSYPAFPIPAENCTELFLAMATAVHGWRGGVDVLIQELFQSAGLPQRAERYSDMLEGRLLTVGTDAVRP